MRIRCYLEQEKQIVLDAAGTGRGAGVGVGALLLFPKQEKIYSEYKKGKTILISATPDIQAEKRKSRL